MTLEEGGGDRVPASDLPFLWQKHPSPTRTKTSRSVPYDTTADGLNSHPDLTPRNSPLDQALGRHEGPR